MRQLRSSVELTPRWLAVWLFCLAWSVLLQLRQARKKPLQLLARQNRPHDGLPVDRRVDRAVVIIRAQTVIRAVFVQSRNLQLPGFLDPAHALNAINNIFPD